MTTVGGIGPPPLPRRESGEVTSDSPERHAKGEPAAALPPQTHPELRAEPMDSRHITYVDPSNLLAGTSKAPLSVVDILQEKLTKHGVEGVDVDCLSQTEINRLVNEQPFFDAFIDNVDIEDLKKFFLTGDEYMFKYSSPPNSRFLNSRGDLEMKSLTDGKLLRVLSSFTSEERDSSIAHLYIAGGNITVLPDIIEGLKALKTLHLDGCKFLKRLPESIGKLTALKDLHLSHCSVLTALPESLGELTALEDLYLSHCSSLTALPKRIGGNSFKTLNVLECGELRGLPGPSAYNSLTTLNVYGCGKLTELPDHSELNGLVRYGTSNLFFRDGKLSASFLTHDKLFDEIRKMPNDIKSRVFKIIFERCELTELPDLSAFTNLEGLHLKDCVKLTALLDLSACNSLKALDVSGCQSLTELPGLSAFTNLNRLDLSDCTALTALPESIGELANLVHLELKGCTALTALPESIGKLTNLEKLRLTGCENLERLPKGIKDLKKLKSVDLEGCSENVTKTRKLKKGENLVIIGQKTEALVNRIKRKHNKAKKNTHRENRVFFT